MSGDKTNTGRRRFLTAATTVVGAVGVGFVLVPFVSSMQPSAKARAAGAPVRADVSKHESGQMNELNSRWVWCLVSGRNQRMQSREKVMAVLERCKCNSHDVATHLYHSNRARMHGCRCESNGKGHPRRCRR